MSELVQVSVLDHDLRAQFTGMRHFAATVEDLNQWPQRPRTVLVLSTPTTNQPRLTYGDAATASELVTDCERSSV